MKPTKTIVLVYQAGIANVFECDEAGVTQQDRGTSRRILQTDFRTAYWFVRGCGHAGAKVRTMSCNVAGDCARVDWTPGNEGTPFRENATIINMN